MRSRRQKLSFPQTHRELFHSLWKSVWEKAKSGGKLLRDGGFRPVLRENGRKREEKSLWKNERLDFSARVMYNI